MAIEENPFDHVLYEFKMYLLTAQAQSDIPFLRNLLVDSRMVHTRNLAYFFGPTQQSKKYLHYSVFTSMPVMPGVDKGLFDEIQRVTSNSTCHLLKGRISSTFKQDALTLENQWFPILSASIRSFIESMDAC